MATEHLLAERRAGVLYLTLNQPDKLNALSDQMIAGLLEELGRAAHDTEVRCVVVTGAGRGFCSGGDVSRMRARNEAAGGGAEPTVEQRMAQLRRSEEVSLLLHEIPKPTIAAINGAAAGAGLSIALACDIRIAADTARLITAFARVGFSGDFGGTWLMTRLVGPARAKEFYFLADPISAEQALALGLVNRVVAAAALSAETEALAKRLASGPSIAYGYMKANINTALTADLRTLLDREAVGQTLTGRTEDHKEAVKAFLDKREPTFRGR
ncbi:MAG TPA: enoyl-CoA hydratase [Candidatus Binataceae bacterium]|jgi:2-(1,2-epoxy-1,2-dihydrophenyl)acetyl-CoA isomerase|nr:enoyl-CoA hydratase [Candidatus Binataceae bacterium]